jgi:hypothetical protein
MLNLHKKLHSSGSARVKLNGMTNEDLCASGGSIDIQHYSMLDVQCSMFDVHFLVNPQPFARIFLALPTPNHPQ